ncbi:MAG: hypothetical protein A2X11_06885 [Bacteroidetes bacterium GWE2_42_24]|nr:MAG: hypothetical protein A2X11_06885 [Bacteroidetes bacterium GWE2_42_24]OFY25971.1 MAG: hypothetical protein A2X09_04710 [Bacteroidetes bacterium GWF2_43_11]
MRNTLFYLSFCCHSPDKEDDMRYRVAIVWKCKQTDFAFIGLLSSFFFTLFNFRFGGLLIRFWMPEMFLCFMIYLVFVAEIALF